MGSGGWFKKMIFRKKAKKDKSIKTKESSSTTKENEKRNGLSNGTSNGNPRFLNLPVEDVAATRIQTAFRGYMARKTLRRLKVVVRFKALNQGYTVKKQASTTLNYLHSWIKIQSEIRARRIHMVMEGRIRQKKLENQLKLDTKLHDLEVEWSGSSDTMEEILGRIQQREEASVKRERAMAYAFSHQWRANSSQNPGRIAFEANWGWSWVERWIAASPWESRVVSQCPKKVQSKQVSKVTKNPKSSATKIKVSVKPTLSNGKGTIKVKGLSKGNAEKKPVIVAKNKVVSISPSKTDKTNIKKQEEEVASLVNTSKGLIFDLETV